MLAPAWFPSKGRLSRKLLDDPSGSWLVPGSHGIQLQYTKT